MYSFLYLAIPFIPILIQFLIRKKLPLNKLRENVILIVTLIVSLFFIITLIMNSYNIYWKGYKSTSWLLAITLIINLMCYITKSGKLNTLFGVLSAIYIVSITSLSSINLFFNFNNYQNDILFQKDNFRIEQALIGIVSVYQMPTLIVTDGFLERRYNLSSTPKEINFITKKNLLSTSIEIQSDGINYAVNFIINNDTIETSTSIKDN